MSKQNFIRMQGIVVEVLPCDKYLVEVHNDKGQATGHKVYATKCGKIIMHSMRVIKGDKVTLEISPYDLTKGRICWIHK